MRTLSELGIEKEKMVYALNKSDLIKNNELDEKIKILNLIENKKWINVSAKNGNNVNELKELIQNIVKKTIILQNLKKENWE